MAGTPGAALHPNLDTDLVMATFRKGLHSAAYSGFEGVTHGVHGQEEGLAGWLRDYDIESVDVVGIATDYCVLQTALDAVREGFHTRVLLDLTAGVARDSTDSALGQLRTADIDLRGAPVVAAAPRG